MRNEASRLRAKGYPFMRAGIAGVAEEGYPFMRRLEGAAPTKRYPFMRGSGAIMVRAYAPPGGGQRVQRADGGG